MQNEQPSNANTKAHSKLQAKDLWGIYWLNKAGHSMQAIADTIGVPKSTVQEVIVRTRKTGTPVPKPRPGRSKKLNERDLRRLATIVRGHPFASYSQIHSMFKLHRVEISRTTLITYLKNVGFGSYWAARKPKLTEENKKKRLRWAKERVNWSIDDWKRVVWSDESQFTAKGNDGGAKVARQVGQRYEADCVAPTTASDNSSVTLWGCFSAGGFGPLAFLEETEDQGAYVDASPNNMMPWLTKMSGVEDVDFIFQDDAAGCHTGGYTTWWKKNAHSIRRFDFWPAQSPDLNPMEHIWSCIERLIQGKRPSIKNDDELKAALREAWGEIHVDLASRLVDSMKDRCRAVIEAEGGPTKY